MPVATVREAIPVRLPRAALMLVVPVVSDVAKPCKPAALLILATALLEDTQATELVRFWVELSV
jgi:hypothetical protein